MKFKLDIKCDNEAFAENSTKEIARILKTLTPDLLLAYLKMYGVGRKTSLSDINGNTVGKWEFSK